MPLQDSSLNDGVEKHLKNLNVYLLLSAMWWYCPGMFPSRYPAKISNLWYTWLSLNSHQFDHLFFKKFDIQFLLATPVEPHVCGTAVQPMDVPDWHSAETVYINASFMSQ